MMPRLTSRNRIKMLKLARTTEEAGDQATESSGDQAKIYLVDKTAVIIGNFIQVQGVDQTVAAADVGDRAGLSKFLKKQLTAISLISNAVKV